MGYLHSWILNKKGNEAAYKKAKNQIIKFLKTRKDIADESGEGTQPNLKDGVISFNGQGKDSHEIFWIPKSLKDFENADFCKTNRKPYDVVVVACLTILKLHLFDDILVDSNGDTQDLEEGVRLACSFLKEQGVLSSDSLYYPTKELPKAIHFIKELN